MGWGEYLINVNRFPSSRGGGRGICVNNIWQNVSECSAKAKLSFSGGQHAPVNMVDSMENVSSSTVSGSKEAMD